MRAVNLLPESKGRDAGAAGAGILTTTNVLIGGAALLAVTFALLVFGFVSNHNTVSDKRATLTALQDKVAEAQSKRAAAEAAANATSGAAESTGQLWLAAFQTAAANRIPWDKLLGDLSRVLPAGSWVSTLSMQAPASGVTAGAAPAPAAGDTAAAAPPVAVTSFEISGIALTNDVVARVMDRLALVPMLSNVTLESSRRADIGSRRAYSFTMNATLNPLSIAQ